jgi:acylaminoacyl-peptidase
LRVSEGGSGSTGSDKNAVFLEIWDKDTELVRVLIPDCRGVNFNGSFGSPIFMPDGETVMFVGEKSDPKFPRGYWAENKDNVDPADKFRYQPDYGETMTKVRAPTLIAFNYVENEWKTIEIDGYHLAFPRSVPGCPDSLLVVGYKRSSKLHVPGLSYCSNRDSCLFRIDNIWSNNIEKSNLSEGLYMVGAATVSSDGSVALFAGQETYFSSHCTELDLFRLDLGDKFSKPVRLNIPKIRSDDSIVPSWNGLYLLTQADAGQISFPPSGDKIVVPTYSSGKSGIFIIDIQKEIVVQSVFPPDITEFSSVMLMQVSGNQIVFVHQGYTCPRSLWLASLDDACNIQYVKLFSVPSVNKLNTLPWYANAKVELIQTPNCPAWLLRSGKEDSPKPLIGYFHGGPHSLALTAFAPEIACYLAAGYDLIIPNYRGSIGFGKEFLNSLIGNAGIVDVADCHACVLEAKRILRPSITVAVGGSHGGFLTAWLVGHPDMKHEYAGGVLWNPASDITSMSLTSDIPEWALSQVLSLEECRKESALCPSESFFHKALKRSPMSVVRNVTAPVMVLLGSADKRVVPCAGLRWAQAVEEYGGKVDLFWFPDQGHAIAGPEFNETAIVAKSKWIESLVRKV